MKTFRVWRADAVAMAAGGDRYRPTATDLRCTAPHVFSTGTNLVVGLDEKLILKIFPPMLRGQFVSERGSLAQLRGRLRVPIPEIVLEGERDGWPYLVITRLPACLGADAWPRCRKQDKERVLGADRRDHCRGAARFRSALACDRAALGRFYARADRRVPRKACAARLADRNFSMGWTTCCATRAELIPMDAPPVILTGEYIPENFLLEHAGRPLAARRTDRFRRRADGMGRIRSARSRAPSWPRASRVGCAACSRALAIRAPTSISTLKRRLMALMLLHRASDPVRHICIEGWQQKADDLFELQDLIWPD